MQSSQFSDPPHIGNWHESYVYESIDSEQFNIMVRNFQNPKKAKKATIVDNDTDLGAGEQRGRSETRLVHPSDAGADVSRGKKSTQVVQPIPNQTLSHNRTSKKATTAHNDTLSGADERSGRSASPIVHPSDVEADVSRGRRPSQVVQPMPNQIPSHNSSASDPVTVVDSTSGALENDVDGPISARGKGVRGPTALRDLAKLPKKTKLPIGWGGIRGGPTGLWAAKLGSYCGTIAKNRDYIPIQLEDTLHNWLKKTRFIHDDGKKTDNRLFLFKLVMDRFDIHEKDEKMELHVIRAISKSYSQHLHDLKDKYFNKRNVQERHKVPENMDAQDWMFLLSKWNSDEHKAISDRNKENRANAKVRHGTGSRSHDRVFDEMTKQNGGVEPTEYSFYEALHTDKAGNPYPMDTTTASIMAAVRENRARAEEDGIPVNDDEVYEEMRPSKIKKKMAKSNPGDAARIDELTKIVAERDAVIDALTVTCGTLQNDVGAALAALRRANLIPPEVVGSDDETQP